MNGAVHGDATITERVPVKKELTKFVELLMFSSFIREVPKLISVIKTNPITNIIVLRTATTGGL